MSCTTCTTDKDGIPKGCKSNGTCASGGCDKLEVYDWLGNMSLPGHQKKFNHVEVRFKNGRKSFFINEKNLPISIGDVIAVECKSGHDIGTVTLTGELVKMQMSRKKVKIGSDTILKIYRKASQKDIDIWQESRAKELEVQRKSRLIVSRLDLKMKLSDIEFQGDGKKATFFYTADERVDFRMLIRELATTFGIRIEMKQVGLRQEAARLGGIGSCGRELCCSTWLTDFRSVSTGAARYQQLSLNPLKLSGQCGKLKCCLNYELDSYMDALKNFPNTKTWLQTKQGTAMFQKMDIFSGFIWYVYKDNPLQWHQLTTIQANEIIELNKKGEKPFNLEEYSSELVIEQPEKNVFENVVGQDSLTRFDKPKRRSKNRNSKNRNRNKNQNRAQTNNNQNANKNKNKKKPIKK
jgi:cell fate regulator YaaT (PSP1 superfamily)